MAVTKSRREQSTVELHRAYEVQAFVSVCVCLRKDKRICHVCFIQDLELICYIEECITHSESRGFIGWPQEGRGNNV